MGVRPSVMAPTMSSMMCFGSFGSTAPLGTYTLTAQSATAHATTTIDTASR